MNKLISNQSLLLASARLLERAAYYGIRAIIVLYALEALHLERTEALASYGWLTSLVYLSFLLGGILGAFIRPRIIILIGGSIQIAGLLLLCTQNTDYLYPGGIAFAIGSGVYSINLISAYSNATLIHRGEMSSGFTLFYVGVNIGAFLGVLLIGYIGETVNYMSGFLVGALLLIASTSLTYFYAPQKHPVREKKTYKLSSALIIIPLILISSILYWTAFEFGSEIMVDYALNTDSTAFSSIISDNQLFNFFTITALGTGLFFLWHFLRISNMIKVGLGLVIAAGAFYFLHLAIQSNAPGYTTVMIFGIILSVSEILIGPIALAIYASFSNPKYLGIVLGGVFVIMAFANKIFPIFIYPLEKAFSSELLLKWTALTLLIFGSIVGLLRFIVEKDSPSSVSEKVSSDLLDDLK